MEGSISQQSHFVTNPEHQLTRGMGHLLYEAVSLDSAEAPP
jgi:hypothetical protein